MDCGFYWVRQRYEKTNRVGYIGSDHDGNLFLWLPCVEKPIDINEEWLENFSFELVKEPSDVVFSKDISANYLDI
jgi:hypothetical protein